MKNNRICCMIQARDCANTIGRLLMLVSEFVDDIIVLDHASKDDTHSVAKRYHKVLEVLRENDPNWANVEMKNKQTLLDHAIATADEWLFWIDTDELPDARMRIDLRKIVEKNSDCGMIGFPEINLWNDEEHYRVDKGFYPYWTFRLIKSNPNLRFPQKRGTGHQMFPSGVVGDVITILDPVILHYGYLTSSMRRRKFNAYMQLDYRDYEQRYEKYLRLLDRDGVELRETEEKWRDSVCLAI